MTRGRNISKNYEGPKVEDRVEIAEKTEEMILKSHKASGDLDIRPSRKTGLESQRYS